MNRPSSTPTWVLAIDPGERYMAWALFLRGELVTGGQVSSPDHLQIDAYAARAQFLAEEILKEVMHLIGIGPGEELHVIVEGQQTREGEGKKGDQQTFVRMALNCGVVMTTLGIRLGATRVEWVPPTRWKGSLEKKMMLRRIDAILRKTGEHKRMKRYNKDTKDAAGIGLWWLRRM